MKILDRILRERISHGAIHVTYPGGQGRRYGCKDAPPVFITIRSYKWIRRLVLDPELALGEAYMQRGIHIESRDLYKFMDILWTNIINKPGRVAKVPAFARAAFRRLSQFNPASRARENAAHHYDIGNEFYARFLDKEMQYSCAYFDRPNMTLEDAQIAKAALVTKKLDIHANQSVLEIGCGWGGLGLYIAKTTGSDVTGITVAEQQFKTARTRALIRGQTATVQYRLQDYRDIQGVFDRIVSVGMFEHVGIPHYGEFFYQIAHLLDRDGIALVHTIGRPNTKGTTNPWIAKYIFPGGYIPALSEIVPHIEQAGLVITDIEVLRLHYAETIREWRRRFKCHEDEFKTTYGEEFVRMWDFYLVISELSFRHGAHVVFQIQLAKRQDAVPLTRDYLYGYPAQPKIAASM